MKKVIIESPYSGDVERNVEYARRCLKDSLYRGESPIASHLLYTQVLDDLFSVEREMGIKAGLEWMKVCDNHVFYVDYGFSKGMKESLRKNIESDVELEFRKIGKNSSI